MNVKKLCTTDAGDGTYAELIQRASRRMPLIGMDVAVAYATQRGVAELCDIMNDVDGWDSARKRWLVGVDYCRSDPPALGHLQTLRESEVRLHDGYYVVKQRGCAPRTSFHPKLYMFHSNGATEIVIGSGNLSYTGLRCGVEAGVAIGRERGGQTQSALGWFERLWSVAAPLGRVAAKYTAAYGTAENRREPAPLDEDEVPEGAARPGNLTASELRRLRVCEHFWIRFVRNRNRGPSKPGNQLIMKRNSRVFFGFPAEDLAPDTLIGRVALRFNDRECGDFSLRFSNNAMEVLTLPVPGREGPKSYDEEVLCFRRIGVRRFELVIGDARAARRWRQCSTKVGGLFRMRSGREWGVY